MKYSCYQGSSDIHGLFIGFLVEKCVACNVASARRVVKVGNPISDGIVLGFHLA